MGVIYGSAGYDAIAFGEFWRCLVDKVVEYASTVRAAEVAAYAAAYILDAGLDPFGLDSVVVEGLFKLGQCSCRTPVYMGASVYK